MKLQRATLALVAFGLVVEAIRGAAGWSSLTWAAAFASVGVLARRASQKKESSDGLLVAASLPLFVTLGALAADVISLPAPDEVRPLWALTDDLLAVRLAAFVLSTRATSLLLVAVCVVAARPPTGRGQALLVFAAAGILLHMVDPLSGGLWLLALLPMVLFAEEEGSGAVTAAFGSAVAVWVLGDLASNWHATLLAIDIGPGTENHRSDLASLTLEPGRSLLTLPMLFLVVGAVPFLIEAFRRRRAPRLGLVGLASLPCVPVLVALVLAGASLGSVLPAPGRIGVAHGVSAVIDPSWHREPCRWAPGSDDTLRALFSMTTCSQVEIVGRGPTLAVLARRGGRVELPFGFPAHPSTAMLFVGVGPGDGENEHVQVQRTLSVIFDDGLWVAADGAAPVQVSSSLALRPSGDIPAGELLAWIDALAAHGVFVRIQAPTT